MGTLMLLSAAMTYSVAGIFMKLSLGLTKPLPSLMAFFVVIPGIYLQTLAMRQAQLSISYFLVIGFEAILAFVFGLWLFDEQLSGQKLFGLALILMGALFLQDKL